MDVGCVIVIRHASEATVICRLAYACTYEGQVQASHVRTSTYVRTYELDKKVPVRASDGSEIMMLLP